jgi:multidrug efflux system outer membrane protein
MRNFLFLFLLCSSCTLYPRYERPCFASSEDWRDPLPSQDETDIQWWTQFNDPVLNQLIEQALVSNQNLQVAMARVDQFKARLGIANSQLYPQIEAGALAQRQKISTSTIAPPPGVPPIFNTFGGLLQASYFVDLWGQIRSASDAAYHEWLSSIDTRRTVVLALVTSVGSTYIQLRQFDQQLIISLETLKTREESLFLANVRFDLGLTSKLEVEQAISEVQIAELQVERLQISIAEAENSLSVLLGEPSKTIARGLELNELPTVFAIPSYVPSEIVCQRPDVLAAEERLIAANANIGVARALFFPQISLFGAVGTQSDKIYNLFKGPSNIFDYGSTIIQEIFTGGRLTSNLNLSWAIQKEMLHAYLSVILTAFQEVNNALTSHKIYLEMVETQRLRVEATTQYLHLSDLRYKEGEIDYLTYLDAERQNFQAQLDYEETKANSFTSLIQIYASLGGPWVIEADAEAMQCKQ